MDPIVLVPIALIFAVCMVLGRNELVRRRLHCPHKDCDAYVSVLQRFRRSDKPLNVRQCSLLSDAKSIDCDRACLRHGAS